MEEKEEPLRHPLTNGRNENEDESPQGDNCEKGKGVSHNTPHQTHGWNRSNSPSLCHFRLPSFLVIFFKKDNDYTTRFLETRLSFLSSCFTEEEEKGQRSATWQKTKTTTRDTDPKRSIWCYILSRGHIITEKICSITECYIVTSLCVWSTAKIRDGHILENAHLHRHASCQDHLFLFLFLSSRFLWHEMMEVANKTIDCSLLFLPTIVQKISLTASSSSKNSKPSQTSRLLF